MVESLDDDDDIEELDSELTGEAAVAVANRQILGTLKWAFRAQPVLDYGIDAQVEIKINSKPTGRLLALQIKGGPHCFRRPNETGWAYRLGAKHVDYWINHVLPVFVIIVDLEADVAYWEHVSADTVVSTGKNYKIQIPRANTLTTARAIWLDIVTDKVIHARERYKGNLEYLPPSAVASLEKAESSWPVETALLAHNLAEGRSNPKFTAETLIAGPPSWLERMGFLGWCIVGNYASEHDASSAASAAFVHASELDPDCSGRYLATAGLELLGHDNDRAKEIFADAYEQPNGAILSQLGSILVDQWSDSKATSFTVPETVDLYSPEANRESAVQAFLGLNAQRNGNENEAIRRFSAARALRPKASQYLVFLADAHARRSITTHSQASDIQEARMLAMEAMQQRRRWGGDATQALQVLVRALALQGDFEAVIRQGAAFPHGEALPDEAQNLNVAHAVLSVAKLLNRQVVISDTLERLKRQPGSELLELQFASKDLDSTERIELLEKVLIQSEKVGDYAQIAASVTNLAMLGKNYIHQLNSLVERGIVPLGTQRLASVLLLATQDFEAALPQLRSLADLDPTAADQLVIRLAAAGRIDEADTACERAYDRLRVPEFLTLRADILHEANELDRAEAAGQTALAEPAIIGFERARIYRILAQIAVQREDWSGAERRLRSSLDHLETVDPWTVWKLIEVQLQQRCDQQAVETISRYGVIPENPANAWAWLRAMVTREWDEVVTAHALSLASRFSHDLELSSEILRCVVLLTRSSEDSQDTDRDQTSASRHTSSHPPTADARGVVSTELRRQAFSALAAHIDRHGSTSTIRSGSATNEGSLENLIEQLSSRDMSQLYEIGDAIERGAMPMGMLGLATGHSYALTVAQRVLGFQLASASDDTHDLEVEAARISIGKIVVVEASALLLSTSIGRLEDVRGYFSDLLLPAPSRDDITRGTIEARGLSGRAGSISWDPHRQQLILAKATPQERALLWKRAELLDQAARNTRTVTIGKLTLFPEMDEPRCRPWLAPIQLAKERGLAFWCDDLTLRHLARNSSVPAFGTHAFLEALIQIQIERAQGADAESEIEKLVQFQHKVVQDLLSEHIVDIPVSLEDLLNQATLDRWLPGSAAIPLTRPSWWNWQIDPFGDLIEIYSNVASNARTSLPEWQIAAMRGVAARWPQQPLIASAMIAVVALLGFEASPERSSARAGLERAAQLAESLGLPNPRDQVPQAALVLNRIGRLEDHERFVTEVLGERPNG